MSNKKRKELQRAILEKHNLEIEKREYPEYCYCEEDNGKEIHDNEKDKHWGYSSKIKGPYHDYRERIFICRFCNKKYYETILWA